jgi:hypothetical protein
MGQRPGMYGNKYSNSILNLRPRPPSLTCPHRYHPLQVVVRVRRRPPYLHRSGHHHHSYRIFLP